MAGCDLDQQEARVHAMIRGGAVLGRRPRTSPAIAIVAHVARVLFAVRCAPADAQMPSYVGAPEKRSKAARFSPGAVGREEED